MARAINPATARLLHLIVERIWETVLERKPVRFIHLDASERGAIAPCLVFRLERGRRTPVVFGLEIKPGPGGVVISAINETWPPGAAKDCARGATKGTIWFSGH